MATASWLGPVMIALSVLLLGRAFYILYVNGRGTRASKLITWLSATFMVGFWTWRLLA
jgi:hypothetical protein